MRLTQVLRKHHLGRLTRRVWQHARERVPIETHVEANLVKLGIKVIDPLEKIKPKKELIKIEIEPFCTKEKFDETHPDWKETVCLTYKDHNVLQNGTPQGQLLTKTIRIHNELPQQITNQKIDISENVHHLIKRTIFTSNIFDAHQELLPKRKDPDRPAWNFPRDYGLTEIRKSQNLFRKLLQVCECVNGPELAKTRSIINNGAFSLSIEKESKLLQFALTFDLAVVSTLPLSQIEDQNALKDTDFPSIYPFYSTVSLNKTNIYRIEDLFPVEETSPWSNVHTIFISHNSQEVKNLSGLPVTQDQIESRAMIKSFTAAASNARKKFGPDIKDLPEPVTVQCVQSNGQDFHFSVFQLNTLDINGTEGTRNFWWSIPSLQLFERACYESGRPVLKAYNPEVTEKLFAFYKNT